MAKTIPSPHGIPGAIVSSTGDLAPYNQIVKTDDDADNGIVESNSNNMKSFLSNVTGTLRTVRDTVRNISSSQGNPALLPLVSKVARLVGIANVFDPAHTQSEVVVTAGTTNHVDLDYSLSGAARERYADDNVSVDLTTRVITDVTPVDQGYGVFAFNVDASVNQTLLTLRDQNGDNYSAIRVLNGKVQYNDRRLMTADTDTQRHTVDIEPQTGQSRTITSTNQSIAFDLPTLPQTADGTATLQDDTAVEAHFNFTIHDRLGADPFSSSFVLELQHHPSDNPTHDWDNNTSGFVRWTTIQGYGGSPVDMQYQISGTAGNKVITWRINPTQATNLGDRFSIENTRHYALYLLDNGRAAADNWTALSSISSVADTAKWNALGNTSADYRFAVQVHPEVQGQASGHSTLAFGARLADGTLIRFGAPTLTNVHIDFGRIAYGASITKFDMFLNNFATHLTSYYLGQLLRDHWGDEYALGYAANNVQGTESEITGNLNVTGRITQDGNSGFLNDFTFDVRSSTHSDISANTYIVQPEDHGQLIAINPDSTCVFVILPQSLWTTEYNFKVGVLLDAALNGLVRVAVPHFIGRPNSINDNAPQFIKQGGTRVANSTASFSTVSGIRGNPVQAENYSGYDFLDLWHSRDWVEINMVNSGGWCGVAIKNLERFNLPQNPTTGQTLGFATQSFSASLTSPTRTIAVTKFRPDWVT